MTGARKAEPGSGPLTGLRVVEFAGLGPAPFACMMLADMGAQVLTVDRSGAKTPGATRITQRGRRRVQADLKNPSERERVLAMVDRADVLVEGFRPGVMERLELGPEIASSRNPRLVYARMTGWGQHGPLAQAAGHDINYIALTGALHAIGPADSPVPPLNLLGDYGGGGLYLVVGILAALHEARRSGRGQVVDVAITDGVVNLMAQFIGQSQSGAFTERRSSNQLDGGTPWYGVYRTSDDQHVSLGAIEPAFFARFCELAGLPQALRDSHANRSQWPMLKTALQDLFASRTLAEWCERLEGTDACFSPVLPLSQARHHAHHRARATFVEHGGAIHPAPAPRFSLTPASIQPNVETSLAEVVEALWTDSPE